MAPREKTNEIIAAVRAFVRQHDLFRPGPLVVAASGGTDSTALCLILAELRDEFGLMLHVAYFDHRTRPRSAAADAAFVAGLANHLGIGLRVGRAERPPRGEDEARRARYAFLRRVAAEIGATAIATGHTRDDQAETVLLHLVRGAGLEGLAGMRAERDGIARPLLVIGRAETALVCRAAGISPREDPTNRSLRFARNRIRWRVLPELAMLNPQAAAAIARVADAAAAAAIDARATAERALAAASMRGQLDLGRLETDRDARAGALAIAWERQTGRVLGARQRAALATLASSDQGTRSLDLPGGRALREYSRLRLISGRPTAPAREAGKELARGSAVEWHGWRLALGSTENGADVALVGSAIAERLMVRGRRPGDRLTGRGGRKVQDVFTDAKVPVRLRDEWPLLTAGDQVIWVPGLTKPPRTGRVRVSVRRPGGNGEDHWSDSAQQVASKVKARPQGEKRGRRRT